MLIATTGNHILNCEGYFLPEPGPDLFDTCVYADNSDNDTSN